MTKVPTIIYVDGFNLFYGALKGGPCKWLDLAKFFRMLRNNDDELIAIKYFTALVHGPGQPKQQAYLDALATTPLVQVTLGNFKQKTQKCQVTACTIPSNARLYPSYEEKRTDVNIALAMASDAFSKTCQRMILVSGDSDLVPAIETAKQFGVEVLVYIPKNTAKPKDPNKKRYAYEVRQVCNRHYELPKHLLPRALFPNPVIGAAGPIYKPADWL